MVDGFGKSNEVGLSDLGMVLNEVFSELFVILEVIDIFEKLLHELVDLIVAANLVIV
jgi:hypothetical protein